LQGRIFSAQFLDVIESLMFCLDDAQDMTFRKGSITIINDIAGLSRVIEDEFSSLVQISDDLI